MKKTLLLSNLDLSSFTSSLLFFLSTLCFNSKASSQCTPPYSETCEEVTVLCSLDELTGYACNNPSTIPIDCPSIRKGHNTSWWGFVADGGMCSITINVGGCTTNEGLAFGIMGDCNCQDGIIIHQNPCVNTNSTDVISTNLTACKTYFLFVDGCSGDICDFTLTTSGGRPPSLAPLSLINNKANRIIEPVCVGACNVLFYTNPQPGACEPKYVWTLDGNEVGVYNNEVRLDFPDPGDFVLCVTAYIGNPQTGSICDQQGPQCATVKVRPINDKTGVSRTLCWEAVHPGGFKWHSQRIFTSGTYREQYTDINCCSFDSIVEFIVLNEPQPTEVFFISCDSTPYIDPLGRSWYGCKEKFPITIPKSSLPYECDSKILLTSAFYSFNPIWEAHCKDGQMEISLFENIGSLCNKIDTIQQKYSWYLKEDTTHTILSTTNKVIANSNGTYCTDVNIEITSTTNQKANCTKTVCYEIKSDSLFATFDQLGSNQLCINFAGVYKSEISGIKQEWSADGNPSIYFQDTIFNKEIIVSWNEPGIKTICIRHYFDLNSSCLICQKVEVVKAAQAGRDFKVLGLQTKMKPIVNPESGRWKVLSAPGKVAFSNSFDPYTRVSVSKIGKYVFEWSAMLKGCSDKDSVTIDFFKLPFFSSGITHLNEIDETAVTELENRTKKQTDFNVFTPSLIQSNSTTIVRIDESIQFKDLEYIWLDVSATEILKGKIYSEACSTDCRICSPQHPGMYFLVLKIDGNRLVRKIVVI